MEESSGGKPESRANLLLGGREEKKEVKERNQAFKGEVQGSKKKGGMRDEHGMRT